MIEARRLLAIAEDLVGRAKSGPTSQTSLRRAISTAYYALFHHIVSSAADALVGRRYRRSPRYAMIYRAFEHRRMREVSGLLDRAILKEKANAALGMVAPSSDIRDVAATFSNLQEQRHWADYDPLGKVSRSEVRDLIEQAELAMRALDHIPSNDRKNLLVFLMTSARG